MARDKFARFHRALAELSTRCAEDDGFARALYGALCNMQWDDATGGEPVGLSWRTAGGVVAYLREKDEDYLDFYCGGGEGVVQPAVRDALGALGWMPVPYDRIN